MQDFINKMAEYEPVKDEFTNLLEVEVREEDLDDIMAFAQREKENIGQKVNIYKEKKTGKGPVFGKLTVFNLIHKAFSVIYCKMQVQRKFHRFWCEFSATF